MRSEDAMSGRTCTDISLAVVRVIAWGNECMHHAAQSAGNTEREGMARGHDLHACVAPCRCGHVWKAYLAALMLPWVLRPHECRRELLVLWGLIALQGAPRLFPATSPTHPHFEEQHRDLHTAIPISGAK